MKSTGTNKETNSSPRIISARRRLAGWMQAKSQRLSRGANISLWLLLLIAAGSCCGWLVHQGLAGERASKLSIDPIRVPQHTATMGQAAPAMISRQEYERIHRFKNYMDSLSRSPSGKHRYDSLTSARPWLMDSVGTLEDLYHQQQKIPPGGPAAGGRAR